MIWPFRQASQPPEAPLWSLLDACGIPFRDPLGDWVKQFPLTASGWSEGLDYCTPDTLIPFITSLDIPIRAQVMGHTDFDGPPNSLTGAVQRAGDHRLNYAKAIAELTKVFGKGKASSASNTVSREWVFGLAQLSCTVWPPDQQHGGRNDRHLKFPNSIEEASIAIRPAWRAPLSDEDYDICAKATSHWATPAPVQTLEFYPGVTKYSRDWPKSLRALPQGIALTPEGDLLLTRAQGIVDIFTAGEVTAFKLNRLTPARGGAEAYLDVKVTVNCRDGFAQQSHPIASVFGNTKGLDTCATELASKLGLPLDINTSANA